MTFLPDALDTVCTLEPSGFADAVRSVWAALADSALPMVTSYALPSYAPERTDDLDGALSAPGCGGERASDLRLELAPHGFGTLTPAHTGAGWSFHLNLTSPTDTASFLALVAGHMDLLRHLLGVRILRRGKVKRIGAGLTCLPLVPIAETSPILVTDEAEIDAVYEDPCVFLRSGWTVEPFGERVLLSRTLQCADGVEFLGAIQAHQWDMARAAKAGATGYFAPQPLDDEKALFFSGEPRLVPVGHLSQGNIVEYSAVLGPGEHLRGWEVFALRGLLRAKALTDGRSVDSVRVVFLDRDMAWCERRPLLDIGVGVFYQGDGGIEEITS